MRFVRASILLVVSISYVSYAFQLFHHEFWSSGLGDWMDPYFINYLLEHWYHSVRALADPSSPPMYFPARKTLGYSHGLVLYVPFYVPLRQFLPPFQAYNLTLILVLETGIACLYLVFRRFSLSFIESLLLTVFFLSSQNVINGATGAWSQRASVFLIPPILLLLLVSARMPDRRPRLILAALSGLLAALLYTQDFYTAHFALAFSVIFLMAALLVERPRPIGETLATYWRGERARARVALVVTGLAAVWTGYLWMFGGIVAQVSGVRIASHDWRRPALCAVAGLAVFVWLRGGISTRLRFEVPTPWMLALTLGAVVGGSVFLWIYLGAYREHPAFPEQHLMSSLTLRDPSRWTSPLDVVRDLGVYDTLRSFKFVFVLGIVAWLPWLNVDRKTRLYCLWLLVVSLVVLMVPVRFGGFSIWRLFFERLPGFAVIRDPKRIIYLYELAVVLAAALLLARLPGRSVYRRCATVLLVLLLVTEQNREVLASLRPIEVYTRWVEAPIAIDASCQSFFIKAASEDYMSRSGHMWTLYNIDAMFISLNHSIPTLNGYSAWFPDGWELTDPHGPGHDLALRRWIERHHLRGVCELDIDARTMKPYANISEIRGKP